ncbi:MAG: NlpC/P60 family N-terminal domain-containing protein, partial [Smithella sp.]
MKIKNFYFILILLLFWGCLQTPDTIKDVRDLPQDHTAYLINDTTENNTIQKEKFLLPVEFQVKMNEDYDKTYFSVWHILQ